MDKPMTLDAFKVLVCALCVLPAISGAEQNSAGLAKQLSNPVAALISVPLQLNYDQDIGAADKGKRWTLNIQLVIPIEMNQE